MIYFVFPFILAGIALAIFYSEGMTLLHIFASTCYIYAIFFYMIGDDKKKI